MLSLQRGIGSQLVSPPLARRTVARVAGSGEPLRQTAFVELLQGRFLRGVQNGLFIDDSGASAVEFAIIVWRTRFVSLGSIMAAVTVAVVSAALFSVGFIGAEAVVASALVGFVVVVAHADNIARLRAGTERRLGRG
jgi:hypothetical protein